MSCRAELVQSLAAYRPTSPEEQAFAARFAELCASGDHALFRDHFAPGHVTASAFVLAPEGDALLLIYHQKLQRWLQPGGHVEPHDASPLAAARREAAEEVGLAELPLALPGIFDLDIHDIPARKREPAHAHFDVRYLFRAPSRHVQAGSDAATARFVPLDQLLGADADASVRRVAEKLRGRAWPS